MLKRVSLPPTIKRKRPARTNLVKPKRQPAPVVSEIKFWNDLDDLWERGAKLRILLGREVRAGEIKLPSVEGM